MAITPTPNNSLFKGFVFDGVDSRDYGVYISGDAVFNAPERDVEMIEIPGRNGAFALDKGRFSNIEVTYPAGLFGNSEADFAAGINALRNALASRKGYCRLEDDYNPNEYRMAVYKSGLDVTPARLKAGQFDIVFECKPQRFLKSGETAQAVTSGGTLTNPTLFESHPMLQVWGYGGLEINGEDLEIISAPIGRYKAFSAGQRFTQQWGINLDTTFANSGDEISCVEDAEYFVCFNGMFKCADRGLVRTVPSGAAIRYSIDYSRPKTDIYYSVYFNRQTFDFGTSNTINSYLDIYAQATTAQEYKVATVWCQIAYSGQGEITFTMLVQNIHDGCTWGQKKISVPDLYIDSTKSALGEPIYFDLDIGEAYKVENDVPVSVNNAVTIPAELPTLKPGTNTVTFDNTITQLKIVPRWWEV